MIIKFPKNENERRKKKRIKKIFVWGDARKRAYRLFVFYVFEFLLFFMNKNLSSNDEYKPEKKKNKKEKKKEKKQKKQKNFFK